MFRATTLAAALVLAITTGAFAQTRFRIIVQTRDIPPCVASGTVYQYDQSTALTFVLPECTERVEILGGHTDAEATTNDVPRITLQGGPQTLPLDVVVGHSLPQTDFAPPRAARNWGGLNLQLAGTGVVRFGGAIAGNLTGSVYAPQISRFDVSGSVVSSISANNPVNFGGIFVVECDTISSAGAVYLVNGNILRVRASGVSGIQGPVTAANGNINDVIANTGSLRANIQAPLGKITGIVQAGGDIGTSTTPVQILAKTGIETVQAQNIYAQVTANGNGGVGNLRALRTVSGGNFVGQVSANGITPFVSASDYGLDITGQLNGTINLVAVGAGTGNLERPVRIGSSSPNGQIIIQGSIPSSRTVTVANGAGELGRLEVGDYVNGTINLGSIGNDLLIGKDLYGDIILNGPLPTGRTIRIGGTFGSNVNFQGLIDIRSAQGLQGQVIINGDATSGQWLTGAEVKVGAVGSQVTLTSPTYTNSAASLGGGSVGVVRYTVHNSSCTPANNLANPNAVLVPFSDNFTPAVVRYYGPVFQTGMSDPVSIDRIVSGVPVPANSYFDIAVAPSGDPRGVRISKRSSAGLVPPGLYVVTPNSGLLRCGGLTVSAPDVADGEYRFRLVSDCNGNGVADPDEIAAVSSLDCNNNGDLDFCEISRNPSLDANLDGVIDSCGTPGDCRADWDQNGSVEPADIAVFIQDWIDDLANMTLVSDFNNDNSVTPSDIAAFVNAWAWALSNPC